MVSAKVPMPGKDRRAKTRAARTPTAPARGNRVALLRSALHMPRAKFARLVGRTERAVTDWESGAARPQGLSQQRVRELERLVRALAAVVDSGELGGWFDTPNAAFGGLKPVEVIERGESDRLWRMVFELNAGASL
jgi:DNA-binding transcriptional regulator YiaG